jgi:hypothetical protein
VFKHRIDHILLRGTLTLMVFTAPMALLSSVLNFLSDRSVSWTVQSAGVSGGRLPPEFGTPRPGTSAWLSSRLTVSIPEPPAWLWWLITLPDLLLAVTLTIVALLLLRTLLDTYDGRPFLRACVHRLRLVAGVIAAASLLVPVTRAFGGSVLTHRVLPEDSESFWRAWDIMGSTIVWLVVAALVVAIAEAFSIGSRLAEDVEGLV